MRLRHRIASRIAGKSAVLGKEDFGDWGAFLQAYGNKKKTGEILWNDWTAQRREYRGTTFACIRKIAPAVAAAPLHLFIPVGKGSVRESKRLPVSDEMKAFMSELAQTKLAMTVSEDVEEITDHPALDVFKKANGSMTRSQLFDRTMIDMMLNGNNYWLLVNNQTDAFPAQINVLPPQKMEPIVDKDTGMVTGYKLKRGLAQRDKKFKLEQIVHFFYPNPHSISQGFSPVSAASQRISGEVNTSTFQNSTLENMGIPAAIVKLARQLPPNEFTEFKKAFGDLYAGVSKANKVGFTQGEWQIEKLGQTLQEMGYIEGAKMLREFIANVLQVPISKLTMESSNRAVAEAGNTEFLRDTILPNLTMIAEELTESLIPMFPTLEDTGAFYMFDNPVPEDVKTKMLMRRTNRTTAVTTPNEERQEDGREPHPSPEANELAPVRPPMGTGGSVERNAADAIDKAVDGAIDKMRNDGCYDDHNAE